VDGDTPSHSGYAHSSKTPNNGNTPPVTNHEKDLVEPPSEKWMAAWIDFITAT